MNSSYPPPDGDFQDYQRTQEIGPAGTPPWWQAGPAEPRGGPQPPRQRRSRGLWWAAGLAVVALLVGGGVFAVTRLAASTAPAGPTGQAAQLSNLLNTASSPGSAAAAEGFAQDAATPSPTPTTNPCQGRAAKLRAAGHPLAAGRTLRLCHNPLRRLRRVGGLHGQFTFKTKSGTSTLAFERGVIRSVSGNDVVVQAADGTTWTWVVQSSTVIRQAGGKKASASALAAGQHVFAGGPVASGSYQARLIVFQASSASSPSPSPAPSPVS
jgi:hypothetical protein